MSKKYPGGFVTNLGTVGNSVFFDGDGDYLSLASNAAFQFGSGDFTIECWAYANALGTYNALFAQWPNEGGSANNSYVLESVGSSMLFYWVSGTTLYGPATLGTITAGSWNHWAICRSGNTLYPFKNGVLGTTVSIAQVLNSPASAVTVGGAVAGGGSWNGFISNVRIVKGTALYTAAFTPPTQLLNVTNTSFLTCNSPAIVDQSSSALAITVNGNAAVSTFTPFPVYNAYNPALGASTPGVWTLDQALQAAATRQWNMYDPYFNLTTLYLPGNGTNGAQNNTFLDSSNNSFPITRNGNTTQGTFSPFSQTGWGVFTSDRNYLTIPASSDFDLISTDFTVEFFVNVSAFNTMAFSGSNFFGNGLATAVNGWSMGFAGAGSTVTSIEFRTFSSSSQAANSFTVSFPLNTWVHVALVRNGSGSNNFVMYVNGVQQGSAQTAVTYSSAGSTFVLGSGAYLQNATYSGNAAYFISNVRVSKTVVYSANFAPPTSALPALASTTLLICTSNRFINLGTNTGAITTAGWNTTTPSVQAFSPFLPTTAYSAATVGGSGYFDGTGDYLTGSTPLSSSTSMSTFTVEGWIYPTTFANTIWVVGDMQATSNVNSLAVNIGTNGDAVLYWFDGAVKTCTSTTFMRLNQWNWFAIVVNNNAISIYVNSTTPGQAGTTTLTNRTQTTNFSVGQYNGSTTPNGYIGSLRWSNGIARTISSIPTAPYTSDANTRLLLNFTNAGITDATAKNVLETVGNAQISTAQSKFGGSSILFDGTGDILYAPYSPNFNFGTGDFTVEFWMWKNNTNNGFIITCGTNTSVGNWNISLSSSSLFWQSRYGVTNLYSRSATSILDGNWHHVAITRASGVQRMFFDGVLQGATVADTTDYVMTTTAQFGIGLNGFDGYIDDLRITKGYARYTTNFTPPTSALQQQ